MEIVYTVHNTRNSVFWIYLTMPLLGAFAKLRKATISLIKSALCIRLSVCIENSARIWWIFMKFDIWVLFENLSRIFNFH
jgi:hypothetical protein